MPASHGWLLLVHQIPPRPLYLRAQVRRRLGQVGALPLKNSVYVLPDIGDCLEDFQWIAQEATAAGGDACVCRVEFLDGVNPETLKTRFRDDAAARFAPLRKAASSLLAEARRTRSAAPAGPAVSRLLRQVDEAARVDFFKSEAGLEVSTLMAELQRLMHRTARPRAAAGVPGSLKGRVWVTRRDPHIDRLATAWLVKRFVDPAARFRFVERTGGVVRPDERSFDMTGADFTHEGDRCSFETMLVKLGLNDPALGQLAEVVHDLDLKDAKFGRPDADGVQRMVEGLSQSHPDSGARVAAALTLFDALFASYGGRIPAPRPTASRRKPGRQKGPR